MAKVVGIDQLKNKIKIALDRTISSREMLDLAGDLATERIYKMTKTGYSLASGQKEKIAKLSDWYMTYRRKYQENAPTGEFFSPRRSNLTLSGQMLEALTYSIDRARRTVKVFVEASQRSPNPYPLKGREEQNLNNAQVAREVARRGRPFIGLDLEGRRRIRNEIQSILRRTLRREGLRD